MVAWQSRNKRIQAPDRLLTTTHLRMTGMRRPDSRHVCLVLYKRQLSSPAANDRDPGRPYRQPAHQLGSR